MKTIKMHSLLVVLLGALPSVLYAQFNQVNVYPPEAAALMSKIDYPIGHLNGMPDIKIPLHTINSGNLELNLELSFHIDNFIKANQMPGPVGAGWSLSSEIQITRTVNGRDDLGIGGYCSSPTVMANYTSSDNPSRTRKQLFSMVSGYNEEEPDKFYYQLLGKTGSFYFKKQIDGSFKPIPVPYDGISITYDNNKFTIVDTDGTIYLFSDSKRDIAYEQPNKPYVLAWKCEEIRSPSGQTEITFDYITYKYTAVSFNDRIEVYDASEGRGIDDGLKQLCNLEGWDHLTNIPFWRIAGPKLIEYATEESRVYAYNTDGYFQYIGHYTDIPGSPSNIYMDLTCQLVSEIKCRNGRVLFNYTNGNNLTSIRVMRNQDGKDVKSINFKQSYEGIPGGHIISRNRYEHSRKLDSLEINEKKYSFSYGFQRQYGNVIDFWGYLAIAPSISSMVPYQEIDVSFGNDLYYYDCTPSSYAAPLITTIGGSGHDIFGVSDAQRTALTIRYPTGGKTEFIEGQNRFRHPYEGTIKGAGGYRIEEIRYYDGYSQDPVKKKIYKYGPNEDGTGIIKSLPSFDPYSGNTHYIETMVYYYGSAGPVTTTRKRTYLTGSTRNITFSNGAPVNYNEVAEYDIDMGSMSGKTVYKYDLYYYTPDYTSPTDPFPFERSNWDIGKLDSVIYYMYVNDRWQWVKKKNYDYKKYKDPFQIFQGRASIYEHHLMMGGDGDLSQDYLTEYYSGYNYKTSGIETGIMQLVKEEDIERDDDQRIIINLKKYFYDNPDDPSSITRIESEDSQGITNIQYITYPKDYAHGGFTKDLIDKNITAVPIERFTRRNGNIVEGEILIYNDNGTVNEIYRLEEQFLKDANFRMSNKANLGDYSTTNNTLFNKDSRYKRKNTVTWDNVWLNPIQVVPDDDFTTSYFWSYNNQYPVVQAKNISSESLHATVNTAAASVGLNVTTWISDPISEKTKWQNFNSALRSLCGPAVLITTYTYDPLIGMTSQTDPAGITTYYEYDSFGRLKLVKDDDGNIIKHYEYHYQNQQ